MAELDTELLVEFMNNTSNALGRIEAQGTAAKEQSEKDLSEVKEDIKLVKTNCGVCLAKIPLIEQGLNNHLTDHKKHISNLKNRFVYPLMVAVALIIISLILRWGLKLPI